VARLSTHVLDLASGKPAAGLRIRLYSVSGETRERRADAITSADGRTAEPLLAGDSMAAGVYEMIFFAGDYLRSQGVSLKEPPFLDEIVIRFGISEPAANYHVPLLLSPYGYSTYRGS
jgi:5-hydroxyisourate hydrolase